MNEKQKMQALGATVPQNHLALEKKEQQKQELGLKK